MLQVSEVQAFVQKNPQLGFSLIIQLTGVHGSQQFDKLTKTKTVETILTSMDAAGVRNYIDFLFKQVNKFDGIEEFVFRFVILQTGCSTLNIERTTRPSTHGDPGSSSSLPR
jgi:DNA polymerase phi